MGAEHFDRRLSVAIPHGYSDSDIHTDGDSNCNSHGYQHANTNSYCNCHRYRHADADSYSD
jgi:hypothetical protein